MDGKGSYFFENGNVFVGEWKLDKKDGKGKYMNKYGSAFKEGNWVDGIF